MIEEPEQEVLGPDVVGPHSPGDVLGGDHHGPRLRPEPHEQALPRPSLALHIDEPLLGGLLAHPDAGSDFGPGGPRSPSDIDEVSDQVVGHRREPVGEHDCFCELVQRVGGGVSALDEVDEV